MTLRRQQPVKINWSAKKVGYPFSEGGGRLAPVAGRGVGVRDCAGPVWRGRGSGQRAAAARAAPAFEFVGRSGGVSGVRCGAVLRWRFVSEKTSAVATDGFVVWLPLPQQRTLRVFMVVCWGRGASDFSLDLSILSIKYLDFDL